MIEQFLNPSKSKNNKKGMLHITQVTLLEVYAVIVSFTKLKNDHDDGFYTNLTFDLKNETDDVTEDMYVLKDLRQLMKMSAIKNTPALCALKPIPVLMV